MTTIAMILLEKAEAEVERLGAELYQTKTRLEVREVGHIEENKRLRAELAAERADVEDLTTVKLLRAKVREQAEEIERLKEELCSWHEGDNECCKLRHEAQIAREEALAEVERLKADGEKP